MKMRARNIIPWTTEQVAQLRALWGARMPAREIASVLGYPGGRNAVIGKANRLGLERRRSVTPSGERNPNWKGGKKARDARYRAAKSRGGEKQPWSKEPTKSVAPQLPPATGPLEGVEPIRWLDHRFDQCVWPVTAAARDIGLNNFKVCGAPASLDRPYCDAHCALAYAPPRGAPHIGNAA